MRIWTVTVALGVTVLLACTQAVLVPTATIAPVAKTPPASTLTPKASTTGTATPRPALTPSQTLAVSLTSTELAASSPTATSIPIPTPIPTTTPIQSPTPAATLGPITRQDLAATLNFSGFTHMPVDFHAVLGATSTCANGPRLEPFFNYYNTSHAEGPRKWYIWACPGDIVKVYLPAKGILFDWGIQAVGADGGIEGQFNGERVLINVNAQFDVSSEITVFYMHLTLRDEIIAMAQASVDRVVVLDAGTHIGYMYWPPPSPYYSLDFGVLDQNFDSGMTPFPGHFEVDPKIRTGG